jgi:hypothetical protein
MSATDKAPRTTIPARYHEVRQGEWSLRYQRSTALLIGNEFEPPKPDLAGNAKNQMSSVPRSTFHP